ncbi:uncharacterized protein At4g08330, chloroplastic-like [Ananas comosus]|uniref:Uncharacterized protein At4g08330, chloroplastic-like n=1 Tax=Ananas comosus TaxID=4615 RepID=A0A199VB21_ANACO|nr:uncharacterized protein At4g08330, chloroplastic-like [Ananas comosus]XP_020108199.1 uncharacterized protein At4g08330, chloroplastic-like [Ananas comosus]OAY74279.1 Uncharacterized protein, chloroplastic [Ananas comosus]
MSHSLSNVAYSCGSCGFDLCLSSSDRNTASIGSAKYGRAMRKGIVAFSAINESRFARAEGIRCRPYFESKGSWGLFRRRTELRCRKCGSSIGCAYATLGCGSEKGAVYYIKIGALRPSCGEDDDGGFLGSRDAR